MAHPIRRITPAPRAALWRLALGVPTALALSFLWAAGLVALIALLSGLGLAGAAGRTLGGGGTTPASALLMLWSIAGLGLGAIVAARLWHGTPLAGLTGRAPVALRHFIVAAALVFPVAALSVVLTAAGAPGIVPNLSGGEWAVILLPALVTVLAQTGAEEVFFRGYIQGQLTLRFGGVILPVVLPSLVFGAAHFGPSLPLAPALAWAGAATLYGLLAADLTRATGSIGAAWGFHFANNVTALLVLAPDVTLSGLALWRSAVPLSSVETLSPLLLADLAILLGLWWLLRRLLSR